MRRRGGWFAWLALAAVMAAAPARAQVEAARFDPGFGAWGRVLARCAAGEGFDYALLLEDTGDFERQKGELASVTMEEFEAFEPRARLAFLINAHNVFAVDRVLRFYPIESLNETRLWRSPLKAREIELLGRRWSLLDLREAAMSGAYHDARALFAMNWAMRGCAPLPDTPATGTNLEDLLERQTRRFVRDERFNRFDPFRRRFRASPLLRDYRDEIRREYTSLWAFVRHFSPPDVAGQIEEQPPKFEFGEWDARLNGA